MYKNFYGIFRGKKYTGVLDKPRNRKNAEVVTMSFEAPIFRPPIFTVPAQVIPKVRVHKTPL